MLKLGVYRLTTVPSSWPGRLIAACLALNAVASHRCAASLWGIDGYAGCAVEVTISRRCARNRHKIIIHESTQTELLTVVDRSGIPCTDPSRTILDLGAVVSARQLGWAVDEALRRDLTTLDELEAVLARHSRRGRSGCGALRELLRERTGSDRVPDSRWNRMVARLLTDAGLARPEFEHPVRVSGRDYRIDLAYPEAMVAIELDSVRWHLNRDSFDADPIRRNDLVLAGWEVLSFTFKFFRENPERLCATVRAALNRA